MGKEIKEPCWYCLSDLDLRNMFFSPRSLKTFNTCLRVGYVTGGGTQGLQTYDVPSFHTCRCKSYGSQWRCGSSTSEPTSQPAAGHHDAPECEQPRVSTKTYHTSFHQTIAQICVFKRLIIKCVPICLPPVWWMMPVGSAPCPQQPLRLPQAWGKAGTRTSRRTYETTWYINCKYWRRTLLFTLCHLHVILVSL